MVDQLICECAGICGVNPDSFTLRELVVMAEGRGKMEWGQTSCIMALLANIFRDAKKTKAIKPQEFNPYYQKKQIIVKAPLTVLRDLWCKKT